MTPELTILMPCLNEARTLGNCITKAQRFLKQYRISGEVLVADNGSTDGSIELATGLNVRVVAVPVRGYGAALAAGIAAAKGEYVIMGDSDASYDFSALAPFVARLREGYDLVLGNRYMGGIASVRHRLLGGDGRVAVLPTFFIKDDLAKRRLTRLLPRVNLAADSLRLIWRSNHPRQAELLALAHDLRELPLR